MRTHRGRTADSASRPAARAACRLLACALLLAAAPAARAMPLDLPVQRAGVQGPIPAYSGQVLEIQLAPAAARAAHPREAGATRATSTPRLGVAAVDAVAASLGATFVPEFAGERAPDGVAGGPDFTAFHIVHLPAGASLADALDRFRALPDVASASPLAVLPVTMFPNDSLFSQQSWLYDTAVPRHDIGAPAGWTVTTGDTSIVIAIIDTGVLADHPDLAGRVAGRHGNLWINWAEANGAPGVDDDVDGYVDDLYGWDFVTGGPAGGIYAATGEDGDVEDNDPNDFAGHGTVVAGIAGALTNDTIGIAGVAPVVRLMPLRIGWLPLGSARPDGAVRMDFAAEAIRYATRKGANVINCSFASAYTAGLDSALSAATQAGVVVVSASGNFGSSNYMATRPDVIAVGATDAGDVYWSGTETGPWLGLVARGTEMASTYLATTGSDSLGYRTPAYVSSITGTSMAAPVVAGVAALVQARQRAAGKPLLTPAAMLQWLRQTGDDVSSENPGQPYLVPRVNMASALQTPLPLAVGAPGTSRPGVHLAARRQPSHGAVTLDWSDAGRVAGEPARIAVYDLSGRVLRSAPLPDALAGTWTWDGRDGANQLLPAGVYFARLSSGSRHATTRVVRLP